MKTTALISTVAAAGLLFLTGCVSGGGPNISDYSTSCMFEVNPTGSYVWSDGDTEVTAGAGGTAEGAAAMNACIRQKAAAAGDPLTPGSATETGTVVRSGTQVTETYTYGTPPASSPAVPATGGERCRRRNVLSGGTGYGGCT